MTKYHRSTNAVISCLTTKDTIVSQHSASFPGHNTYAKRGDVFDVTTRIRNLYKNHNVTINPKSPDFALLRPFFAWAATDTIKRTFDVTTRWARATKQVPFRKHFKSRFPALNIHRRREPVATDTIYSDTPAIDNGATVAQIFVGIKTLVTDVYSMKTDSDFDVRRQHPSPWRHGQAGQGPCPNGDLQQGP